MLSLGLALCLCGHVAADPPADPTHLTIELIVGAELIAELIPLERASYTEAELEALFARLRRLSRPYCRMRHDQTFDAKVAASLISKKRLERYDNECFGCQWDIKAGCWNYYQMNDRSPEVDFALVKHLVPADAYDCYSVGFAQPYMMHNVLGCRSLTMVDFDWRIHDAHFQLLKQYRAGALNQETLDTVLASLSFGWLARSKMAKHEFPAQLRWICKADQQERCAFHLGRFQQTLPALERVVLNLSPLHQVKSAAVAADTPRIFYLSNALLPTYISRDKVDKLLAVIGKSLHPRQRAFLVHHVGGDEAFGLYELHKTAGGHTLTTACKDPQLVKDDELAEGARTTVNYLDRRSKTKGHLHTCHGLLAQVTPEASPVKESGNTEIEIDQTADGGRPAQTVKTAGGSTPVALWRFEKKDRTVKNHAAEGLQGTLIGDPNFKNGIVGQALMLDGRDDGVAIAGPDLFDGWQAVTIAAWVRPLRGAKGKWPTLIEKAGGKHQHVFWAGYKRSAGRWAIQIATNRRKEARFLSFGVPVGFGEWSHVAIVISLANKSARLFLNGELKRERHLDLGGTALFSNPGGQCALGQITRKPEHVWKGGLDEVRIYPAALRIDEIAALAKKRSP